MGGGGTPGPRRPNRPGLSRVNIADWSAPPATWKVIFNLIFVFNYLSGLPVN